MGKQNVCGQRQTSSHHRSLAGPAGAARGPQRPSVPWLALAVLASLLLISACTGPTPELAQQTTRSVTLEVDGQNYSLVSSATSVRELLAEAGITTSETDEVTPPLFTPLTDNLEIQVVRVTESIEVLEATIPFDRKTVRNEAMDVDASPVIIQGGRTGLQEITVRIVYHDGLEVERQQTQVTVLEEPQDEIVMIGVGATLDEVSFAGSIAYISGGNAVILRGATTYPEQLDTGPGLDGRVFALSPTGSHLLYTRVLSDTGRFNNSLWVISTARGAQPRSLGISDVLWADWNPARTDLLQIAYTTALPVDVPPGWEANNDLWLGDVLQNEDAEFRPEQVVEAYPATYGWWGGNYLWSPAGSIIAYGHADEVGLIDTEAADEASQRIQLHRFTEYNTRSDWVWLPSLAWSPDGNYLAFTTHSGTDDTALTFDTWVADVTGRVAGRFIDQSGMWSHPHWSPAINGDDGPESRIAFLRATNPVDSLNSTYTLWLMDQDGSNATQIYPPVGENSRFPREQQLMAWGPTGQDIAFIFDNALYLFNLSSQSAFRITQDDTIASRPTWAPYGAAITTDLPSTTVIPPTTGTGTTEDLLPDDQP